MLRTPQKIVVLYKPLGTPLSQISENLKLYKPHGIAVLHAPLEFKRSQSSGT